MSWALYTRVCRGVGSILLSMPAIYHTTNQCDTDTTWRDNLQAWAFYQDRCCRPSVYHGDASGRCRVGHVSHSFSHCPPSDCLSALMEFALVRVGPLLWYCWTCNSKVHSLFGRLWHPIKTVVATLWASILWQTLVITVLHSPVCLIECDSLLRHCRPCFMSPFLLRAAAHLKCRPLLRHTVHCCVMCWAQMFNLSLRGEPGVILCIERQ